MFPGLSKSLKTLLIILIFGTFPKVCSQESTPDSLEVSHIFYILSNTGPGTEMSTPEILDAVSKASKKDKTASLLLLGNITAKSGYPAQEQERMAAEKFLRNHLLKPLENFNGNIIFTPGENEWSSAAPQSLDDLESFLQQNSKREFVPDDGCPVEEIEISEEVVLITVDSQWFLEDWDRSADFNMECDIRDRERFFIEIKDAIKDNDGKVKLIAMHHPVLTANTPGIFSRVFPFSKQNFESPAYRSFRKRLETLASQFDDVIFVSGHHKNLQYLHNDRNPQIISATAAATESARAGEEDHFASEVAGFAKLTVFKNGNSRVEFYNTDLKQLFQKEIPREKDKEDKIKGEPWKEIGETHAASIYTPEETKKSGFHRFLWGEHYRELYSKEIEVPVLLLDSLSPVKEGGGQQSRSIRFKDKEGHEYTLRALRKDPIQYLQADVSPDNYLDDLLDNTIAERLVLDYFTTSHPYAKYSLDHFAKTLDIPHIKPEIYYVPRQPALEMYNDEYGNALFELQAHAGEENKNYTQFGDPNDILSTFDLLEELREDKNVMVDEAAYIKARLLDMLVGDWDRHQDQWRWAEFEEGEKKRYVPIPRDRDQAFSKYDGALIPLIKLSVPMLRKMQTYDKDIDNIKWFNWSGYPLDLQLLYKSKWEAWQEQVAVIRNSITDEQIEIAFNDLPEDAQDASIEEIKQKLKGRRGNLMEIAREYYNRLQDFVVITGTNEDDAFEIERQENAAIRITQNSGGEEIFSRSYNSEETDEIWIYGMDGDDSFKISGEGDKPLQIRVLGGAGKDTYDFRNKRNAKLYDFKSSESNILNKGSRRLLVDSYEINNFHYKKFKHSIFKVLPYVNFETDAGFTLGVENVWTRYSLVNNPFQAQHKLLANYYTDTNGYSIRYTGEFAHLFYNWNLGIDARYTSPNYTLNYFGSGTEATYFPDDVTKEYNRVKIQKWHFRPSLIWRNEGGSSFKIGPLVESLKVKYEPETYLAEIFPAQNDIFDTQVYAGGEANYHFNSKNTKAFPNLGSDISITTGYKSALDDAGNEFGYLEPVISMNYPLMSNGFVVIATKLGGKALFGDDYEFYHAATIGGNRSLRGYRNHRFNGKQAFYHSTDLRTALGIWENRLLSFVYGVTAGFDYGRVWVPGENSEQWHNNYGGAIWISAGLAVTGTLGIYHGGDGNRLAVTLNFKY